MESELLLEELDKNVKDGVKMSSDSQHKFEELSRRLSAMEVYKTVILAAS